MSRPGRHFAWGEFEASPTARRLDIDNAVTDADHRAAIEHLCAAVLDPLREALGRPVRITSGYRSAALNDAIGGARNSQHMRGEAADIKVDGIGAQDLARRIAALRLPVDQVVWYDAERGGHVHVSSVRPRLRGEYLHAPSSGGYRPWAP